MTYLIITNQRDITSDYIVRELRKRKHPFYRLNTEKISNSEFTFSLQDDELYISLPKEKLRLSSIKSGYFRRPLPPNDENRHKGLYWQEEWASLLKSIYMYVGDRWLNHPNSIAMAEDKVRQLRYARSLGFLIPRTIVSNSFNSVYQLSQRVRLIGKPLKQALVKHNGLEKVIFTTRLPEIKMENKYEISEVPAIYQEEIIKSKDVRVTVVGENLFPVAIDSQSRDETVTDWRKGSVPNLEHDIIELPEDIKASCLQLVRRLDLRFGAIDLILDRNGCFWFLECNPNGQWAWIENRTGLPISAAIVDELERLGEHEET